ncbi:type I polyketide synthase [Actinokineospora pegani]|uniref:type I polyketide synthase n=1 Tax=Actinokineospora pegani TaxID=2654637 RepID=UPI0012EA5891|nr:type I polyketide synthase [Actinokineospora pegani]
MSPQSSTPQAPRTEEQWRTWLGQWLSALIERDVTESEFDRPLRDFGVSSRSATMLAAKISEELGEAQPSTLVWTAPTIADLARTLAEGARRAAARAESGPVDPGAPIAVVGLACRLPGAPSAERFWSLLTRGEDAIGEVPPGRWAQFADDADEHGLSRAGGYLDDVSAFDAEYFGISPREAELMDPQQRLLLEVAWEALVNAGLPVKDLRGTETGVFVGLSAAEYAQLTMTDLDRIDAWSSTGAAASLAANRLSYALGVHGPSMTVDTACSSSLVAVHLAMRALRAGEASAALVGGVNLLLSPGITANFQLAGALAADGRCKPFDAAADGIVRGEGCGVVVLKRLDDAKADGDRVLAVLRGSAVNSDGRSNGIMAPNPLAQEQLLARAYAEAGVTPRTVDYVEAHGTGTLLGDPIEAGALAAVLGEKRHAKRPLLLGSVKSNLGHLEGAAGIVGLIKVVLGLRHSRIPRSLRYHSPNPHIDFAAGRLSVVSEATDWPRYAGVARAGVSAFGFGGTNAHVVLEEWPHDRYAATWQPGGRPEVVALSARSPARLRAKARALAGWLDDGHDLSELAAALVHGDERDGARVAVPARDHNELRARLLGVAEGRADRAVPVGTPSGSPADPVFVFSGHGSQWPAMGARLLAEEPAFAAAVAALDPAFTDGAGISLTALLDGSGDAEPLARQQLALFGAQVALAELWRAHGVRPAAVVGHSMGEVAAAVAVGALGVADGLRVMVERSALLDEVNALGVGAMAVVELTAAELDDLAERFPGVEVAVYASPTQCTVSGPTDEVAALVAHVEERGGLARRLAVTGAGHSAAVDPVLDRFRAALGELTPGEPAVRCYTSVLDDPQDAPAFDTDYWAANLRRPVRFTQALAAALRDGHRTFVEVSPHPVAAVAVEQTGTALGIGDVAVVASLRRDRDGASDGFAAALAAVHVLGHPTALRRRYPDRVVADLPPVTWQHRSHWVRTRPAGASRSGHPFLGERVELPDSDRSLWRGGIGAQAHPWLADHVAHGVPLVPAFGFVELLLAAARQARPGSGAPELRAVALHRLLPVTEHTEVSVSAVPDESGTRLSVHARVNAEWVLCAAAVAVDPGVDEPFAIGDGVGEPVDPYPALDAVGLVSGPAFRVLREVRAGDGVVRAGVEFADGPPRSGFALHPVLGEALAQAVATAGGALGEAARVVRVGRVRVTGDGRHAARVVAAGGRARALDAADGVLAEIDGVEFEPLTRAAVPFPPEYLAYRAEWVPTELPTGPAHGGRRWLLLHDEGAAGLAAMVSDGLAARGQTATTAPLTDDPSAVQASHEDVDGVVLLPTGAGSPDGTAAAREKVLAVAGAVRALAAVEHAPPRLWLATGGAAVARPGESGDVGLAALRGLVRVLAFEHPELSATWVDLTPADVATGADELVRELVAWSAADEVAWRDGRRSARVLRRTALPPSDVAPPVVREGAYLITGGLGGLGLVAARWLAERGATRVVLTGRRAPSAEAEAVIAAVRGLGVEVEVVTGDIAEPGVAAEMVSRGVAGGTALRGVLHAAGVLADGAVLSMSGDDLAAVWRAKTEGALRLHEASAGHELDWWLAYSSAAGLLGSPGQGAYATANAWLDAFTAWRRGQGLPGTTVQWGAWAETGGAAGAQNPVLEPMPTDEAMAALSAVLAAGRGETGVTRMDASAVVELFPRLAERPFFGDVVDSAPAAGEVPWAGIDGLRSLAADDPDRARELVREHVVAVVAELMGMDPDLLPLTDPLTSLGLDSLMAMRARAAMERDFGLTLPLPLLLRGASLAELADHLAGELGAAPSAHAPAAAGPGTRDLAERWTALVWRKVLGDKPVAVDVPFAEAGGDNAAAARLLAAVSDELGREVTAEELFATPTIAGMADAVRAELEGAGTGPVRLLGGAKGSPPLFLFHAAGSPTAVYKPMIRLLGADVACYGVERVDELVTVEEKAAHYIELMREIQPEGPYRIGGWSFGGLQAFETARQLTALGDEVELLFLIDTIIPLRKTDKPTAEFLHNRLRLFIEHIEQTYQVDLGLPESEWLGLDEDAQQDLVMQRLRERVSGMGEAVLEHQQTSYLDARIAERYTPTPYAGHVLLFRAKDPHPLTTTLDPRYLRTDDALGWDEFCADLDIVRVAGDHITVIDPPHVAVVADRLTALLRGTSPHGPRR